MKTSKKVLSILLAVLLLATTLAVAAVPVSAVEVGDTIHFGYYPQSEVNETTALKNAANNATWKSYGYYIGTGSSDGSMTASDYMKYADFFLDGVKYRAVKFTQYRPCFTSQSSSASNTHQDENHYSLNTTYYFKYEPLKWRVLDPSTGLVLCDRIIDSQAFQNVMWENGSECYLAVNSTYYANNSTKSSISHWLNNDFYETAFNASQKNNIKKTTVTYTAYSSDYSQFNSVMADRKMFLLSYDEAQNSSYGLSSTTAREAKGTAYAKCQGLWVGSFVGYSGWWLRSAGSSSFNACRVNVDGDLSHNYSHVNETDVGIRPACKLTNLTSDFSQSDIYTISASADPSAGGTVTGDDTYGKGETVTLRATPNSGYDFTGWYKGTTRVTTNKSYSFTVSADAAYTAKFTPKNYTVTANADTGGSVIGSGSYTYNTSATLTAIPKSGYQFIGWYKGDSKVSADAIYSFTVTENVTLTAKFARIYTVSVTANPTNGGTVTGGGTYAGGETVTLTATPNPGYKFVQWEKYAKLDSLWFWSKVSTEATYSFTVESYFSNNTEYRAVFEENTTPEPTKYTVTANVDAGGSATGGGTFDEGATATLTAMPNSGYHFLGWYKGDSKVSADATYSFTVTENVTLTAKFEKDASSGDPGDPGTTPTDPQPDPNMCHWCGKTHEGFFQGIIGFFHNIMAKIFGNKY